MDSKSILIRYKDFNIVLSFIFIIVSVNYSDSLKPEFEIYSKNFNINPMNVLLGEDVIFEEFVPTLSYEDRDLYLIKDIRRMFYSAPFENGPSKTEGVDVTVKEVLPEGIGHIGVELPLESKLEISGRKSVAVNYGNVVKTNPPTGTTSTGGSTPTGITSGFTLNQELQVRLSGTVGKRITVNVDYDDTKEQQRDISLIYKGEGDELVQRAEFGDVTLTLPNTEFTGYNKKIFGGEIEMRYKNLSLKAIGAQTKGKTKTVTFVGGYTQVKTDIYDINFVKYKYYRITSSNLPIVPNSEQIWLDDMNGYNNNYPPGYQPPVYPPSNRGVDVTQYTQPARNPIDGKMYSLDYLHPGIDYTIDYNTGIITFNKSIQPNYVIFIAYKYNNGSSSVGYSGNVFDFDNLNSVGVIQPIQSDSNYYSNQLMNYYNLGNKKILLPQYDPEFVFKIYDANNNEKPITNFSYSIDVDTGVLIITKNSAPNPEKPFAYDDNNNLISPNAYPDISSTTQSRYRMHIEYKYKFKTYQLQDFNIVKYSEVIVMDGRTLVRDVDYTIDYEVGFIFFFNEDKITDKTQITVTYEYMPFGGGFQSNLFGARAEFNLSPISIGSTYLFNGSQIPVDVPNVGSTPSSLNILDIDGKINLNKEIIESVFGKSIFLPSEISFSGEIAKSFYNPNIYESSNGEKGVGMIDSMEGIDNISGLPVDYNSWFPSSRPVDSDLNINNRANQLTLSNYDDYGHDTSSVTKKQLLKIDYNFTNGIWDGIRYPVSNSGSDYSRFKYLEIWINTDWTKDTIFNLDIGVISEDINENGYLDTEDKNNDNLLNPNEDTGIPVKFAGSISNVGANNNRLDREDMDNNNRLDTNNDYYRYSFTLNNIPPNYVSNTIGSWKLIKIPLDFATTVSYIGSPSATLIKHVRLWLKNNSGQSGSIIIESIQFTGNKWELKDQSLVNYLDVKTISKDLNSSYEPLTDGFFKTTTQEEKNSEKSLSITYNNTASLLTPAYIYKVFTRAQSYLDYNYLRVDIYKKTTFSDDTFFIRLESDDSNYYQYNLNLSSVSSGWQTVTFSLDSPTLKVGNFYLNNVKQISMGVISTGEGGEIWVNNLRVSDSIMKEGTASRLNSSIKFGDFLSTTVDYKNIGSNFNMLEDSSVNPTLSVTQAYQSIKQTLRYLALSSTLKPADFIPITFDYKKDEVLTDERDKLNPNYLSYPEKFSDNYNSTLNFTLLSPLNISLNGNYKNENIEYLPKAVNVDNTYTKSYSVSSRATYSLPSNIFGFPIGTNNLEGAFEFSEDKISHSIYLDRNTYTISRGNYYKWIGGYEFFPGLSFSPFYSTKFLEKKGNIYMYNPSLPAGTIPYLSDFSPQTFSKSAGVSSSYSKIKGMLPKINYNGTVDRDYNLNQLRTNNSVEISSEFRFSEWLAFLEPFSPTLNLTHRVSANALYDKYDGAGENFPIRNLTFWDEWWVTPSDRFSFNSSQIVNDTANGRFKLSSITFSPRGTLSNERNKQSQFLTKTNVASIGSGVVVDSPSIPILSLLNPTSMNIEYDFKNVKRMDASDRITSNSFTHTGNFTFPFRMSDVFNGSLLFNTNIEDKEENNIKYNNRSYTPGIDLNLNLIFTDPIKLPDFWPFGGATIKIEQGIRLNGKVNLNMTRNKTTGTTIVSEVNSDLYTVAISAQYNFSRNIRADLGMQFNYFNDNISKVNNYYAYGINLKVNAIF